MNLIPLLYFGGLVGILLGERLFAGAEHMRLLFSGGGTLFVLAAVLTCAKRLQSAEAPQRKAHRLVL